MSGPTIHRRRLAPAALAASIGLILLGEGTASAAGRITEQVTCGGQVLTIAVAPGNDGNNWGAGQIEGGGHLVQATLEYAVHDDTAAVLLDDEVLTRGKAHAQQETVTCDVASQQAILADVAPAGYVYPPGTAPTDEVTSSLRVTVVPRP